MESETLLEIKSSPTKIKIWKFGTIVFPIVITALLYISFGSNEFEGVWAKVFVITLAILTGLGSFAAYLSAKKYVLLITNEHYVEKSLFQNKQIRFSDYHSVSIRKEAVFYVANLYEDGNEKPKNTISVFVKDFREFPEFMLRKLIDHNVLEAVMEVKEIEEVYGKKIDEEIESDFSHVRRFVSPLNIIAVVATFTSIYKPLQYELLMHLLIAFPVIGALLMMRYPKQIKFEVRKNSKFIGSQWMILFPSFAMLFRAMYDWQIEEYSGIFYAALFMLALIVVPMGRMIVNKNKLQDQITFVIFIMMYSFGTSVYINCHYDKSQSVQKEFDVIDFDVHYGKSTEYYVVVNDWDLENKQKRVKIGGDLYRSLNRKSKLKINFKNGLFGSRWFVVEKPAT